VYENLEEVDEVLSENGNSVIDWTFSGPLGTRTTYQTVQSINTFGAGRSGLLYGLKKSEKVTVADGIILLSEKSGVTTYYSVDFFNADWGGIAKLFKGTIWSETCESTAKAVFKIKYLAEHSKDVPPVKKVTLKKSNGYDSEIVDQICSEMKNRKKQKEFEKQILEILD
jgi:hypothetical protein